MCTISFLQSFPNPSSAFVGPKPSIYRSNCLLRSSYATPLIFSSGSLSFRTFSPPSRTGFRSICAVIKKKFPKRIPQLLTPEENARRLYVGRFPHRTSQEELAQMFGAHGTVERVEIQYNRRSRRSKRFGFVMMKTVEEANAAAEKLNGIDMGGCILNVNIAKTPVVPMVEQSVVDAEEAQWIDSPYKLDVGNLTPWVTAEALKKYISKWTNVLSARIERYPGINLSKRYGYVTFPTEKDMMAALDGCNYAILEGKRYILSKVVEPEEFI